MITTTPLTTTNPFTPYSQLGWSVIPLQVKGKLPDSRLLPQIADEDGVLKRSWKPYQQQAPTPQEMEAWWRSGTPNVGIVTGVVSGLVVLDLDSEEAIVLAQERGLPLTPTATTGKGLHIYFRHPGREVSNRANFGYVPGFDLRGDGGYVVAPPSIHPSGRVYAWEIDPQAVALAEMPAWLMYLLFGSPTHETGDSDETQSRLPLELEKAADREQAYVQQAVEAEVAVLRHARKGERNHQLNRAAFVLGQLVGAGVADEDDIALELERAAIQIGLSPREARLTISSGLKAGKRDPRQLPDFTTSTLPSQRKRSAPTNGATPLDAPRVDQLDVTDGGAATGRGKESQTAALIRLGEQATLFHTPTGEKYARYQVGARQETAQIAHPKSPFRLWLERQFYQETGQPPNQSALQQALAHLEQVAYYDGARRQVFTRLGYVDDTIYLAIGDEGGHIIEITAAGWQIIQDAPVIFRTTRNAEPLPWPERGGSIEALRPLLNVASEAEWQLCIGWMVGALNPWGPYAHIAPSGEQGSGKSALLRILRAFTDPAKAEENTDPRTVDDFMVTCLNNHVISYDNLSALPDWLSDALCRLATGAGLTKRMLYSDLEEIVIEAARPAILNGITDFITRPDLLERTITFELPRIAPDARLTERRFNRLLVEVAPGVMGALLDAVVMALQRQDQTQLSTLPRMADFVTWVEAAAPAFGWAEGAFLAAFESNVQRKEEQALEGDEVAETLVVWVQHKIRTVGDSHAITLKHLLAELSALRLANNDPATLSETPASVRLPSDWPDSPRGLSVRLGRAKPMLRKFGVEYERGQRTTKGWLYSLRRLA